MKDVLGQQAEQDLEFDKVKSLLAKHCETQNGKEKALQLKPVTDYDFLQNELQCVSEYKASFDQTRIPAITGENIDKDIKLLYIENTVLEEERLSLLRTLADDVNNLLKFFKKQHEMYPLLYARTGVVEISPVIPDIVNRVLNREGRMKANASPLLMKLKAKIANVRREIEKQFQIALSKYRAADQLDDTRESYINGRRTLAVKAEFKRKVNGPVMGSSGSGKIAYVEPAATMALNNELAALEQEERDEIYRILREVTREIRSHLYLLEQYNALQTDIDFVRARAKLANELNARMPLLRNTPCCEIVGAYHPLLFLQNRTTEDKTYAHDLRLKKETRFLVISGPNAGGKSITLKTVGLISAMTQSGLLIPVKEGSEVGIFDQILTDIGDNQSIENKLSTYSYRLGKMRHFLNVAGSKSLVLIDEFGTGSDPDLGGALAEVCFEELYSKGTFGVFTTHYSNIKVKTDTLPEAVNAGMLFNRNTLKPLFKLSIGEPGSSFTFEVAQKNRIPKEIIEKAKKRVSSGKLDLEKSIGSLQKEKQRLHGRNVDLNKLRKESETAREEYLLRKEEMEEKLMRVHETAEENNKLINYGKRFEKLLKKYDGKNLGDLIKQFVKTVKVEHTKSQKPKTKPKLAPVDKQKKKTSLVTAHKLKKKIEPGHTVIIKGANEKGKVVELDKKEAVVHFGQFKTRVKIDKLQYVKG